MNGKYCKLCNVSFPSTRIYIEHYATVEHTACLRDKHRDLEKDFCIFCQQFYDTVEEYASHLNAESHAERIKEFRHAIKAGNNKMEQLIAMNVIAMPPPSTFLGENQKKDNTGQPVPTFMKAASVSNRNTSNVTTALASNKTESSAVNITSTSKETVSTTLNITASRSNRMTSSAVNITSSVSKITTSNSKSSTPTSNVTTSSAANVSTSNSNLTAMLQSSATTSTRDDGGPPPAKIIKVLPKIDLTKMKHSRLAQLAIRPRSKEDELIVDHLIREHAKSTREKEIAERLGPNMENLIKEATAFSILNLLKEQGICSDPVEYQVETLESKRELTLVDATRERIILNKQGSKDSLPPITTIKTEVVDLESPLKTNPEPMETTNWVEELNRPHLFENGCDDFMGSAKLLQLSFENEQIQSQLEVVDRQIAQCIDLRLYLLRKRQFIHSEMSSHLKGTRTVNKQELPSLMIPPQPSICFTPIISVPTMESTVSISLPIEENLATLPSNDQAPLQMETGDIVVINDESEVEMRKESSPKPKRKKKRIEYEVSTLVTVEPKTDLDKNVFFPTRQQPNSNTAKPVKETETNSEVVNRSSQPVLAASVAQSQKLETEKSESVESLPCHNLTPTENAINLLSNSICGINQITKRNPTEDTLNTTTSKRQELTFANSSSICKLRIHGHRNEVKIMKGYLQDVFTCSTDGTVKRFQLHLEKNRKEAPKELVCVSQYVHDSKEVCGMELLPMKTSFFIIIANKRGFLQKFNINSKWCFASVNTRVKVTCMILRWNMLFLGTVEGTILTYCAVKLELKSSYSASKTSITCLGNGLEGACRRVYVGSMEEDVSVRDALSGLLNRWIKLKPNHYCQKIQIVQDMMFTLVVSKEKRDDEKIYIHRHVDGKILYLIEDLNGIQCMSVSENKLLVFSDRQRNLYRFDYETKKVVKLNIRYSGKMLPSLMLVHNNLLITGTKYGHLVGWMDGSFGDQE